MTYTTLKLVTKNTITTETETALALQKHIAAISCLHTCFTLYKDVAVLCLVSTRLCIPTPKPYASCEAWRREYNSEVCKGG